MSSTDSEDVCTTTKTFKRDIMKAELCDMLHILQQHGDFCDVTITVNGQYVTAHRAVLAASSPYFARMFKGGFKESNEEVIDLSGSIGSIDMLKNAVRFMYTGKIDISCETLTDILGVATLLMVDHLIDFCTQFILNFHLVPENCLHTWLLADLFSLQEVQVVCQAMARCRFRDYIQYQSDLVNLPGSFMKKLAKVGVMDFLDSAELGTLLLHWLEKDEKGRLDDCIEVLKWMEQQQKMNTFIQSVKGCPVIALSTVRELKSYLSCLSTFHQQLSLRGSFKAVTCKSIVGAGVETEELKHSLYLYVPEHDKWYTKSIVLPDVRNCRFLGSTAESLVFRRETGGILIGICINNHIDWILEARDADAAGDRCVTCHIWDGQLVMIRIISGQSMEFVTAFTYNFDTKSWRMIGKTYDLPFDSRANISQIHCYSHKGTLYIYVTCSDCIRIALLKLQRLSQDSYVWFVLVSPVSLFHLQLQCESNELAVFMVKSEKMMRICNRVIFPCIPDTLVDQNEGGHFDALPESCWPVTVPPKGWHGCETSGNKVVRVDSDMVAPAGTPGWHPQGYIFMKVAGEFMTQCWRGVGDPSIPNSFAWLETTPMPNKGLIMSCHGVQEIHTDILQHFDEAQFLPKKTSSPLQHVPQELPR